MFQECFELTEIDVSKWNMSNCQTIINAFFNCYKLKNIPVENWDVRKVYYVKGAFARCLALTTIDISKWELDNIDKSTWLGFSDVFSSCGQLTTIKMPKKQFTVGNCDRTFGNCSQLKELDLSSLIITNRNPRLLVGCKNLTRLTVNDSFRVTPPVNTEPPNLPTKAGHLWFNINDPTKGYLGSELPDNVAATYELKPIN